MASKLCKELKLMMDKMKSNMAKQLQELNEKEIMSITDYMSKLSTIVASNREHLKWHQALDTTIRIQCIVCGYIICRQQQARIEHQPAISIEAFIQGFLSQKQLCLKCNAHPDPVIQQGHVREMLHFDNLCCSFMSDFDAITNEFQQLIQSSCDKDPDHNIIWP
eukprot:14984347-Ditylum_brightwellii.AAC.1